MNDYIIGAITASQGFEYTGSFAKLQCVSGSKEVTDQHSSIAFDRIEFGHYLEPQSNFIATHVITSYTHSMDAGPSDIQGPITRFKMGGAGEVLAYFTKQKNESTEPA